MQKHKRYMENCLPHCLPLNGCQEYNYFFKNNLHRSNQEPPSHTYHTLSDRFSQKQIFQMQFSRSDVNFIFSCSDLLFCNNLVTLFQSKMLHNIYWVFFYTLNLAMHSIDFTSFKACNKLMNEVLLSLFYKKRNKTSSQDCMVNSMSYIHTHTPHIHAQTYTLSPPWLTYQKEFITLKNKNKCVAILKYKINTSIYLKSYKNKKQ